MSDFSTGIPNIRVVIRENTDDNLSIDVPNISVNIQKNTDYNVNIIPTSVTPTRTGSWNRIADLALTAISSSYAVTASYALNADGGAGFPFSGSAEITGSLKVTGAISASSITGSFKGDGSQLTGLVTDLRISGSTGSDTLSLLTDTLLITGANGIVTTVTNNTVTVDVPVALTASLYGTASVADGIDVIFAGIYKTGSDSYIIPTPSGGLSYITSASYALTASYLLNNTWDTIVNKPNGIVSGSQQILDYNIFATTGSNIFVGNQTITGSLYISNNLVVLGSSSIQYVSQSTLNIGTNLITVNTNTPSVRFGGLAVIDSGSSPLVSGSLLFDSINDQWVFVHQTTGGTTSSVLLMGPQTYNNLGNETNLTTNKIPKSVKAEHLGDSQISDNGTTVSITNGLNVGTSITATSVSASFSGSLKGTLQGIQEEIILSSSIGATTSSFDFANASIFYLTGMTGTGAWNIINIPTASQRATTLTFVIEQGATAYSASLYQLNSSNVSVKWLGTTVPTGSANKTDVIGLTAFRSGSTWNVLGVLSSFG